MQPWLKNGRPEPPPSSSFGAPSVPLLLLEIYLHIYLPSVTPASCSTVLEEHADRKNQLPGARYTRKVLCDTGLHCPLETGMDVDLGASEPKNPPTLASLAAGLANVPSALNLEWLACGKHNDVCLSEEAAGSWVARIIERCELAVRFLYLLRLYPLQGPCLDQIRDCNGQRCAQVWSTQALHAHRALERVRNPALPGQF